MKCDNNSIYEFSGWHYIAHKVPLGMLYVSCDDIFLISKIHSRQLIIFMILTFFAKKKKNLQKSAKKFLHDKYALTSLLFMPKTIIPLCHQTTEILDKM